MFFAAALVLVGFGCAPTEPVKITVENATYQIDGRPVALANGKMESVTVKGAVTKTVTRLFGAPVYGDLDGDGDQDAAVLIEQDMGGSGTFYYAAAATNAEDSYQGTNAILLGDRVAPQTIEIHGNTIVANYAQRGLGEPMTVPPSIGVSKTMRVVNGVLE